MSSAVVGSPMRLARCGRMLCWVGASMVHMPVGVWHVSVRMHWVESMASMVGLSKMRNLVESNTAM